MKFGLNIIFDKNERKYAIRNNYTNRCIHLSYSYNDAFIDYKKLESKFYNIPRELLVLACSEQVLQGNEYNPIIFAKSLYADKNEGGFNWDQSVLGDKFWIRTLSHNKYDKAIELYYIGKTLL